jgi:serine/threonine protein kinase/Tol biopolymer transport system component
MTIAAGTKLGPYEILSAIGAGGMGEVYQAHDTKLARDVAIKVLPDAFAYDADRLARFQREAKMLASLNHPNIATIFGLEQSGGVTCLVMELVPGETLQERVKRDGPVPVEEALAIAKQIAEALEAAHEKSIIHRDLKPANVKVTPEGKVKVLDFGLAKAFAGDTSTEDIGNSPTLSMAATMQGVILGTAAYMSPEQARGKSVDKRTDIWAFGCVLYELVTGKQAFTGEDITEILAAVVKTEPDWAALPVSTPTKIRDLLRRCLHKDVNKRARDAGDARIEIEEALTAPPNSEPTTAAPARDIRALGRRTIVVGIGCLLLGALVTGLAVWHLKPSPLPQRVSRFSITLPQGQQLAGLESGPIVALSPDGTHLAYVARQGGVAQIYLRAMDSLEAKPIPGNEGATNPFFSPDSQWLGFFADGKLKKVSVSGGAVLTLTPVGYPAYRGVSWGSQGTIVFTSTMSGVLLEISDAGGTPRPLNTLDAKKGEISQSWPEFLPGAKAVLFDTSSGPGTIQEGQVSLYVPKTGERRDLLRGGMNPRYAPTGDLLYVQGGTLMATPFDVGRLAVTGGAVPIVEGVMQSGNTGAAQYSFSDNGALVYVSGEIEGARRRLVWVNRKGAEQPTAAPLRAYLFPQVSPDGKRVAVAIEELGSQVWIYDLGREALSRLTFERNWNGNPIWTPDSKRVTFGSGTPQNLFWQAADGSGTSERLSTNEFPQLPSSWSPDGQTLAFFEVNPTTRVDLWIFRLSDRKAQPFLRTPSTESVPRFSPDGHWLAYMSDESGRREIYVRAYPGPGGKWQISTEGGTEPVWNPNGRELFYRSGDKMMAVDIAMQPSLSVGKPNMLFEGPYLPTTGTVPNYDVSPDGQRFLMVKPPEQAGVAPTQINVVLNWFEELKQKVPTGEK